MYRQAVLPPELPEFNMILKHIVPILFIFMTAFVSCSSGNSDVDEPTPADGTVITLKKDVTSLLRNPCMGWGLYEEGLDGICDADKYWSAQSDVANRYGSFFYMRYRWSDLEPDEGRYAWIYDENYKKLVKGALDRGLKLAFRFMFDARSSQGKGCTPDYVREAGAKGYYNNENLYWSPYPDDPVFLSKLEKFLKAFAAEYDNPAIVDFIDGYGLGIWGEAWYIIWPDGSTQEHKNEAMRKILQLYAGCFRNVNLILNLGGELGHELETRYAYEENGYGFRRDGLGSMYFTEGDQNMARQMYGRTLLIGEACYWAVGRENVPDDFKPWENNDEGAFDSRYKPGNTWKDVYYLTLEDVYNFHFNTLDLREAGDSRNWLKYAPDMVQKFIEKGGYRLYPERIVLPSAAKAGTAVEAVHQWVNDGTGYLPNNMRNWNFKYKPAFALVDSNDKVVKVWVDDDAEPSTWLGGKSYDYKKSHSLRYVLPGKYRWAVAIVDKTKDNTPGIRLAIMNDRKVEGWSVIGDVVVE